ncbi:MAG: response regulator [Eubacteriales bacterium]|nr:response regulator [Eubacteriales bacterium]
MLKVFLVEDEIVMREGIKNNIPWAQEGFEFAGEASDGELAYPLIQKTKPDILITDIRMPFMDGLELSRLVKKELPSIKIIILSGYDEFEYAKEAISIGITDYLVKPVSGAQLLEAVRKVARIVEEEKQQKQFLETFERERMENTRLARQKFFRSLVSGKHPVSALLEEGRAVGLELAANRYNILLFQVFDDGEVESYSEETNRVTQAVEDMAEQMDGVMTIELGLEGWAFILKASGEEELAALEEAFSGRLQAVAGDGQSGIEYFGGLGRPVGRLSELNKCFEQANRAFAYRYLKKRGQIVRDADAAEAPADEQLTIGSLDVNKVDRKVVSSFLKTGIRSEIPHFMDEYFASVGEQNIQSLMFRQYVTMDAYLAAAAVLEELGCPSDALVERCGDFQSMSAVLNTIEQTKDYLSRVFETVIGLRESVSQRKYSSLLKDARAYIRQNFDNEDISLNTVAASVNLSPNHFSTIFSQETGQTFIEFLTAVRMEKAKELLRATSMKTAEIAFAVGYKDPHYFSYLFKKTQECTPREFRARA